jgi:hypothetical protein
MSSERRHANPGKKERQARKRHRRGSVWVSTWGSGTAPLKAGRKHMSRIDRKLFMAVANVEKSGAGDSL